MTPLEIRELETLVEYQECCEIQEETWGRGFSERVPAAILRVGQKVGGVTAGAFGPGGRMLGFVFGLTGLRDGRLAHWSDMLAVREEARGQNIGERLKHYQRERVLGLGIEVMYWTFDPLVARNAHLNINKLGAGVAEYVENMYGTNTGSTLHGAIPTDRFVAAWELRQPILLRPDADVPLATDASLPLVNPLDDHGLPVYRPSSAPAVRLQLPLDASSLAAQGADHPLRWRLAVRQAVVPLLRKSYQLARVVRAHEGSLPYYVFAKHPDA